MPFHILSQIGADVTAHPSYDQLTTRTSSLTFTPESGPNMMPKS